MKRLSEDRADWLLRQQRLRELAERRASRAERRSTSSPRDWTLRPKTVVISLPQRLTAERIDSRELILDTLDSLIHHLSRSRSRVKLDFSGVRRIFPGGMLMLLAYLELLSDVFPRRLRVVCHRGSMAAQLIRHFGFGQRLGVPEAGNAPRHDSVLPWRFATGQQADGARLHEHIRDFAQQIGSTVPDGLYNALTEATTNVQHHAYPPGSDVPEVMRRWWLFSRVEYATPEADGALYLAFYDVGVGIPDSMRNCLRGVAEKTAAALESVLASFGVTDGKGQDGALLKLAVEHPRTSTGLPFRGKGLPEMKDFAAATPGGRLTIISGHGQYSFRADSPPAIAVKCNRGILGTLILWNLPLSWKEPTT